MKIDRYSKVLLTIIGVAALWLSVAIPLQQARISRESTKILRAQGFELADKQGKVWASLSFDEKGNPGLNVFDGHGSPRASVGLVRNGPREMNGSPAVLLFDKGGRVRLNITSRQFVMEGYGNDPSLTMGLGAEKSFGLGLFDKHWETRAEMKLSSQGNPVFALEDSKGKTRAEILLTKDGDPVFRLLDKNAKVSWQKP